MTVSPPPPPGPPSPRTPLGFDELLGVVIAFAGIGAILFWSLGRREQGLNLLSPEAPLVASPLERVLSPEAAVDPTAPQLLPQPTPTPTPSPLRRVEPEDAETRRAERGNVVPVPLTTTQTEETATIPETSGFSDVPRDFWAYPFIAVLSERGIISGFEDGTFRPDQPVTRAEFASMVSEAFDQGPEQRSQTEFEDVASDFWAESAIQESYRIGFLEGYPGDVFRPTQQIPRVQVLVALATGLGLELPSNASDILQIYQDAEEIPDYAIDKTAAATESGLVVNHPNTEVLNPNENATRAEVAAFLYQALVNRGEAERIESEYIIRR